MASVDVDIKKLLEAGAHFGHKTSRWHPKMAQYIHSKRSGSHIIDLTKTVENLEDALDFAEKTAAAGKQILFVGTKRQARDILLKAAEDTSMPYVVERWVGGMLTNTTTMNGRIKHLKDLETKMDSGALEAKYNKLEVQRYQEEIDEMNHMYGGIKYMANRPGALLVVDVVTEMNAIREARKLGVPVIAIVDTNADPSLVDYPIPANDDAIKTIELIVGYFVEAINKGRTQIKVAPASDKDENPASAPDAAPVTATVA
jgi:small subunit ribosomal protein S2